MSILSTLFLLVLLAIGGIVVCVRQPGVARRGAICYGLTLAATAFVAFPLSIAIAFSATPLWAWLGSVLGVRLTGRAGPPLLCYLGTFVVCTGVLAACSISAMRMVLRRSGAK